MVFNAKQLEYLIPTHAPTHCMGTGMCILDYDNHKRLLYTLN